MRSQGPILDVVLPYLKGKIKKSGTDNIITLCPFHDDHSPSFWLNVNNGLWICFSCGLRGGLHTFLKNTGLSGESLDEAMEPVKGLIRQHKAQEKRKRDLKFRSDPYLGDVVLPESLLGVYDFKPKMMVKAGFETSILRQFDIGYDHRLKRVTFPLRDLYGNLIGISGRATVRGDTPRYKMYRGGYRDSSGRYIPGDFGENFDDEYPGFHLNAHRFLWNSHNVYQQILLDEKGWEPVVIVEGFKACMWLVQHGFPTTVALMGSSISEDQMNLIVRMSGNPVVLFLDNDEAGRKATWSTGKRLRPFVGELLVADYPEGKDAPDDLNLAQIRRAIYGSKEWREWVTTKR